MMILFAFFICLFTCGECFDNASTEQVLKRLAYLEEKYDDIKMENADLKAEITSVKSECATVEIFSKKLQMEKLGLKEDITSKPVKSKRLAVTHSDTNLDAVGFYARVRSSGTLGVQQTIEFDHVHENSGNGYQPLHGHFTAPIAGLYYFTTTVYSMDGKDIHCELVKNGVNIGNLYAPVSGYSSSTLSAVIKMNVGEMVWVRHLGATPQVLNAGDYSSFAGFLISQ